MPSLTVPDIKPNRTVIIALSAIALIWLLYAISARQQETVKELRDLRITITRAARKVAKAQETDIERPPETASPEVDAEVVEVEEEDEDDVTDESDDDDGVEPETPSVPTPEPADGN